MPSSPIDQPPDQSPVRPVLAWVAVALVVAAGVLLVIADGKPQAEVEHLEWPRGTTTVAYTTSPGSDALGESAEWFDQIVPRDAAVAQDLVLVAILVGVAAITCARQRAALFGTMLAAGALWLVAAHLYGAGGVGSFDGSGSCAGVLNGTCPGPVDGITERWRWSTPQLTMQLVAAGLLLIAAAVTRTAHREAPELQPTLSDRDVARLLR